MFFMTILIMFTAIGFLFLFVDMWFPIFLIPMVSLGLRSTGAILLLVGVMLYIMRSYSTGAHHFIELPNPNSVISLHQGKTNTKIIKGKKQEPNRIEARGKGYRGSRKYMNIKDTGEPLNVAGHDVVISSQDVGHNIPLWIADLVDKWKKRYGIRNEEEFEELYTNLKEIDSHSDLKDIEILKPVMNDMDRRLELMDMDIDDLRDMRELLFDGRTVNVKNYLDWSESATPYDNESIIDSDVSHRLSQMNNFFKGASGDMMKYVIMVFVLIIAAGVAYQMFG